MEETKTTMNFNIRKEAEKMGITSEQFTTAFENLRNSMDKKEDGQNKAITKISNSIASIDTTLKMTDKRLTKLEDRPYIEENNMKSLIDSSINRRAVDCSEKFATKKSSTSIAPPRSSAPDWSTVAKIMVPLLTVGGIVFLAIFGLN